MFTLLFAFPFFGLMDTKEPVLIWLAIVLGVNIGHDLMYGPQGAYFSELFGDPCALHAARRSATSSRRCSRGGFAPLIAVALLAAGGGDPYLVALYMAGMGAITVVATLFARETYQHRHRATTRRSASRRERFVRKPAADREPAGVA